VFLLEDLRERILSDRQVVALYQVNSAEVELPNIDAEVERFDKFLDSEFGSAVEDKHGELLQALGLRP